MKKDVKIYEKENNLLTAKTGLDLSEGEEVTIIKYCHYSETTNNNLDESFIKNAYKDGYEIIKNEQKQFMNNFWNSSRVLIDCDDIIFNEYGCFLFKFSVNDKIRSFSFLEFSLFVFNSVSI